jgi:hypothetical protein
MVIREHEPSAHDHSDPRMRDLGGQLSRNTEGWRELEDLKRETVQKRGVNDGFRYKVHQKTLELAEEKRAILRSMERVDPSFRPYDLARARDEMDSTIQDAQSSLTRLSAHQGESYLQ